MMVSTREVTTMGKDKNSLPFFETGFRFGRWRTFAVVVVVIAAAVGYWQRTQSNASQREKIEDLAREKARALEEMRREGGGPHATAVEAAGPITQIYVEQLCLSKAGMTREQIAKRMHELYSRHGLDEAVYTDAVSKKLEDLAWSRTVSREVHRRCPGPAKK
jgi:type II secretory pathway pseudopilin PulG